MRLFSCENLTVTINQQLICDNLQLDISAGDCWGVLGPNGSGKTTLLKTFAGLHQADKGNIFLNEENIKFLSRKAIARKLGMLFQHTQNSFDQTVMEYCLLGRHPHLAKFYSETQEDKNICLLALKQLELEHLQTRKLSTLSGGERKRVNIAMLLAQTPQIFLLDEPTNHVDLRHQIKILEFFQSMSNAGIVMALHDVRWAKHFCNNVILLFPDGKFLIGSTQKILTEKNLSKLYKFTKQHLRLFLPLPLWER